MRKPKLVSIICIFFLMAFVSCQSEISEKEFLEQFKKLSDKRINFRLNMKALGDSSFAHLDFSQKVFDQINQESAFEATIAENYKAYTDSLRSDLKEGRVYFYKQWYDNKPLISTLEKADMKHDNLIQSMKKGDVSESDGLDSLQLFSKNIDAFITKSDSLVKASTARYWAFRKTFEEYKYNMKNLKYLYAGKTK